jgi:transcriptional regulator of heat shock response
MCKMKKELNSESYNLQESLTKASETLSYMTVYACAI